ncbi:MAG: flagellar biosynthetic protein FliO [Deltaproteobacteria bacterium]|nr:flagellar biosynthetic protein FliO [Deltaproteobacteria bacterium]
MIPSEWIPVSVVTGGLILLGIVAHRMLPFLNERRRTSHHLKHLGTLPLTPHCCVAIVQVGRETLILGIAAQSISLLSKANEPLIPEELQSEKLATVTQTQGGPRSAAGLKRAEEAVLNYLGRSERPGGFDG